VDIIEIDAASNRGIDEIRQLKEGIRFAPTYGKYKIFIIDEVHMLTKEAFNALLKTLEEPPLHAIFVLATTEINKVLPTIISRSQRFDFRRLRHGEIADRLALLVRSEKKKLDKNVLNLIAARADGSVRDAESMLGQILSVADGLNLDEIRSLFGFVDFAATSQFINYIADKNKKSAVAFISEISDKGVDLEEFIKSAMGYVRWMMFLKIDPTLEDLVAREISVENLEELKQAAQKFEMPHLQKAARLFQEASVNFKYSPIPQLPLEMAVLELLE
jgi:DNA polymerase-3 subunit gamma/tau